MKYKYLTPKIVLLEFPTYKEMNLTLFRIAEFSESNTKLRGKYFTADEFIEQHTDAKGAWKKLGASGQTYFEFWDGYNIPASTLSAFWKKSGDISKRELGVFDATVILSKKGYIIATRKGDVNILKHELAHAYFFDNAEYKAKSSRIVSRLPKASKEKMRKHLNAIGYDKSVHLDEMQAYLVSYSDKEWAECFPTIQRSEVADQVSELNNLYRLIHGK